MVFDGVGVCRVSVSVLLMLCGIGQFVVSGVCGVVVWWCCCVAVVEVLVWLML